MGLSPPAGPVVGPEGPRGGRRGPSRRRSRRSTAGRRGAGRRDSRAVAGGRATRCRRAARPRPRRTRRRRRSRPTGLAPRRSCPGPDCRRRTRSPGGARLARREPAARLLLRCRCALAVTRRRGPGSGGGGGLRCRGRRGGRVRGGGSRVHVAHGRAHHDGRDGARSGDVDPDPRRQRGLRLAFLGDRPAFGGLPGIAGRAVAGTGALGGGAVRRRPRGVRGTAAPLGPGGRTVSFTAQSRFSRLAPPPVSTSRGLLGGAHHHTGRGRNASGDRRRNLCGAQAEVVRHFPSRAAGPGGCRDRPRVAHITATAIPPRRNR